MSLVPDVLPLGNFFGTGMRGGLEWFVRTFGPAAAHTVVSRVAPQHRPLLDAHDPGLGILGARKYSYAFTGDLFRTMGLVAKMDEDAFLRDIVNHGVDATLNTVGRAILRYAVSPQMICSRAQEMWNAFHDCGRITILSFADGEYLAQLSEWPNHDTTVCKIGAEARRRVVEKTGLKVEVRRERCQAWGHEACTYRVRWRK
jgi:predicted hydrocarbon binding protein